MYDINSLIKALEAMSHNEKMLRKADYWANCAGDAAIYLRKIVNGEFKEVVRGRWIKQNYIDEPVICSKCKCCPAELQVTDGFLDEEYPYCPHCGAKMEANHV